MRLLGVLLPGGDLAVESGQLPSRVCPPPSTTLGTSRLLCPWNSPGKNTGVGSHSLLQGIFPAQGLNPRLLHGRWILYLSEPAEKPYFPESHHHSCRRPPTTHIKPSLHPSPGSGPPALTPLGTLGQMVRSLERCPPLVLEPLALPTHLWDPWLLGGPASQVLGDRGRGWEAAVSAAEAEGSLDLRLRARAEDLGPAPSPGPILPVRSGWEEPQQLTCLPRSAQGRQPGQSHDGNQTCWLDAQSWLPP